LTLWEIRDSHLFLPFGSTLAAAETFSRVGKSTGRAYRANEDSFAFVDALRHVVKVCHLLMTSGVSNA
jgi:hypothetical protein